MDDVVTGTRSNGPNFANIFFIINTIRVLGETSVLISVSFRSAAASSTRRRSARKLIDWVINSVN